MTLAASGPLAVLLGVRLHRPDYPLPWYLAAAGLSSYVVADVVYYHVDSSFPGPADVFYLASYPFLIAAVMLLIRRRNPGRDVTTLIDASIIAAGVALVEWVYLVEPRLEQATGPGRLVIILTLVGDVIVLTMAARLVGGRGNQVPAFYLMVAAIVSLLVTNVIYSLIASDNFTTGTVLDAGWLGYYCLLGAAALHPSMRTLASPGRSADAGTPSSARLILLTSAVLVAPIVLAIQGARAVHHDVPVVAFASVVLFGLVMARIAVLMQSQQRTAARERTLREAAAALVGATDRQGTYAAAMDAVTDLVGPQLAAARLAAGSSAVLEVVAARGCHAEQSLGGTVEVDRLPVPVGSLLVDGGIPRVAHLDADLTHSLHLDGCDGDFVGSPVLVGGDLRAAILTVTDGSASEGIVAGLDTLASQLSLALESAALTEELHQQHSEARFRALVQNSSDAIALVDADSLVRYQSPSVERIFDVTTDGLLGTPLLNLVHDADRSSTQEFLHSLQRDGGNSAELELRMLRSDGSSFDAELVGNNLEHDPNVRATVVTIRDVSERKQFESQLREQAFGDSLTGLANRVLFRERLAHALARKLRHDAPLAVVAIGLDDFKLVNDSLGHTAGDEVLVAVADRLRTLVRPGDTTARLGNDEFGVVLESLTNEEGALRAVERAIDVLKEPIVVEGKELYVQATAGIAFADSSSATPDELMRNADVAMYVAKTAGKAGYAVYESRMHAAALERLDLRADLQRAIDNDEFVLHYQPIVSLETSCTVGLEALVRWEHPERGIVPPGAFIELAEETGLIVPIGTWVLHEACRQAAAWQSPNPVGVSINLSQKQLQQRGLVDTVRSALDRSGVDPARITLEITESAVMADATATVKLLDQLRDLGVQLAVDDFGTGYSSLAWLRRLPIDVLKVDKEFVDAMTQREEDLLLVGAIIDLAHIFQLRVVAEGIEDAEQLGALRRLGCDLGQGYFFAKPTPAGQVGALLDVRWDVDLSDEPFPTSRGS